MSYIKSLSKKELINPPEFVKMQTQYEVMMGSISYGIAIDTSDVDIYGFCIPSKDIIFPHLSGEIQGFGRQIQRFDQFQAHHVYDKDSKKEYDISIYNIIKYFQLVMDNNPNMIDSLFVPQRCVLHCSQIGDLVRQNRKLFLHKGIFHKLKGYAYSQLHKMRIKKPEGKRKELIEKYGYDTKFATHVVRLLVQCEQVMMEGDLDLERNREQLKSIRRGEWKFEDVVNFFNQKERELESLYHSSKLQHSPNEKKIKTLLLNCLEMHFGTLDKCIVIQSDVQQLIADLEILIHKYKKEKG